jgi:hypothetical protein
VETHEDGGEDVPGEAVGDVVATLVDKKTLMAAINRIKAITAIRCFMRPPEFEI